MTPTEHELAPALSGAERALAVRQFALSGRYAILTLESPTGGRFTYRCKPASDGRTFVDLLTGPQNTTDYTPLGVVETDPPHGRYTHSWLGGIPEAAPAARGARWFFAPLAADLLVLARRLPTVRVYHAGNCGRCGRLLTTPESVELGLGPVCATKD